MKKSVYSTALVLSCSVLGAAPALAQLKYDNASGGSVLLYGQFDLGYQSFDDGVTTTGNLVDNTHSNSRVSLWVRQPYGSSTFSFNFETALGLRASAGVSQVFTPPEGSWHRTNIRKVDFSLKTPSYGTFYAGQGSMATDGAAETDFSGTALVNYSSISDTAGAFRFRDSTGTLTTRTIGGSFTDLDGARRGRIRYDTPSLAGFTLSVAYGEEILASASNLKSRDVALRYGHEFDGAKLQAAVGYKRVTPTTGPDFDDTMGSVSVLLNSGVNATLAAGRRSNGGGDYAYGKIGYRHKWFAAGETAVAVDYYSGNDLSVAGSTSEAYGLGIVQKVDSLNTEVYLGLRNYSLSEPTTSYLDSSSILVGARWKF